MKYPTWTKRDGTKVKINQMTDSHLLNAIKLLERNAKEDKSIPFPNFQGVIAQDHAEQEYFTLLNSEAEDLYPILGDMKALADERGLEY